MDITSIINTSKIRTDIICNDYTMDSERTRKSDLESNFRYTLIARTKILYQILHVEKRVNTMLSPDYKNHKWGVDTKYHVPNANACAAAGRCAISGYDPNIEGSIHFELQCGDFLISYLHSYDDLATRCTQNTFFATYLPTRRMNSTTYQ